MSIKNHTDLNSEIDSNVNTNGSEAISGFILNNTLKDLADSAINKLGDTGIGGILRYSSIFSPSNDGDIPHKKYVDDLVGSIDLSPYYKKDGTNGPLTGALDLGGNYISNLTKIESVSGSSFSRIGFNPSFTGLEFQANDGVGTYSDLILSTTNLNLAFSGGSNFILSGAGLGIKTSGYLGNIKTDNLTANRTIQFQDKNYTGVADLSDLSGLVSTSRTLNINGVSQDLSSSRTWKTGLADTGVLTFAGLTYNSGTTINIGAVSGQVVDNETNPLIPTFTSVSYAGATNVTVTTVGSGLASYVMLSSAGAISFQNTFPTSAERKSKIYLGKIGHPTGTINSSAIGNEPDYILSPIAQIKDLYKGIGFINNGVVASANGANLNFNISTGVITRYASNFVIDKTKANEVTISAGSPQSFLYRTQTGAGAGFVSLIDPTMYDLAGTITAIPGGGGTATNQYIYCVPGLGFIVQYGQILYTSITNAIAAIGKESFTVYPSLVNNAVLVGVLSVTKNATVLNNTSQAQFFRSDKFGQSAGSTSGISTATLQSAYDNSLQPQILTSTTLGAVQFKRGSAADTDLILSGLNGAGSTTFSITGAGIASFSNLGIGTGSAVPSAILHLVDTGTITPRGATFDQYNNGSNSAQHNYRKARGTFASPATIVTADVLSNTNTWGHDGTNFIQSSSIRTTSVGTIGTNRMPSKIEFMTSTDASSSVLTTALTLDQSQNATIAGNISAANLSLSGVFTTTGAFNATFAVPRSTTWTLPNTASETLAGLGTAQSFSAVQTISNSTNSTSSTTGALIVTGGIGLGGSVYASTGVDSTHVLGRLGIWTITAGEFALGINSQTGSSSAYSMRWTTSGLFLNTQAATSMFFRVANATTFSLSSTQLLMSEGINFSIGTTTGTKYGTATNQKQGWYNATPVVQQSTSITGSAITANSGTAVNDASTFSGYTIGQVVAILKTYGFLA